MDAPPRPPKELTFWCAAKEFPPALRRRETWQPHRNPYWLFGFVWGLPIPFATLAVECAGRGWPLSAANLLGVLVASPWQWYFALHPLLFGIVFGAIGTMALQRSAKIQELLNALHERADTDGLTGLMNHRAFHVQLRNELTRARRNGTPVSLLMIDLDRFKRLNDAHGHPAGDAILALLARRLRAAVREYDLPARYGGEEFAVILPGLEARGATDGGERVRRIVADSPFPLPGGGTAEVTVSIGVAALEPEMTAEEWLAAADARLYAAKRSGRNRVVST